MILLVALLIRPSFFVEYGVGEFRRKIFKGDYSCGRTLRTDPSQERNRCNLSDSQLQETNPHLGNVGLPHIDGAIPQDLEDYYQKSELQGKTSLGYHQVGHSNVYTEGKLDAQIGKFGVSSVIEINQNTFQNVCVQAYRQGYYDTYVLILGVAS